MHDFKYEFTIVYCNKDIQRYLDHIKDIYNKRQIQGMPFSSFLSYCENNMLLQIDVIKNDQRAGSKIIAANSNETEVA
jgi:hypothetical protein